MNYRKVIGFGGNSYVVSLPKDWAVKNNLKKGDMLTVMEEEGKIQFSLDSKSSNDEKKTKTVDADGKSIDLIRSEIVGAYLNNYDVIEIISTDFKKDAKVIKDTIRNLSGLEIMMQTSKKIIAKDILDIHEISIRTIIKRMDFITRGMIDDSLACLDGKDQHEDIYQRDLDVNRLHFLAYRVIKSAMKDSNVRRELEKTSWGLFIERIVVTKIENIADSQKRISRYWRLINISEKDKNEIKKIYKLMKESYLIIMKAYYTKNVELAFHIEVTNRDRIKLCNELLNRYGECFLKLNSKELHDLGEGITKRHCVELASIIEYLKDMSSSIKYLARAVIEME